MTKNDIKNLVKNLIDTFLYAGDVSINLRKKGLTKKIKLDNTPVSNGDLEINKIISKKDNGIYDAMNKGLKVAKGEIIVFCNSGDFFYKNSLQKVMYLFDKFNYDFVFGTVLRNYTKGKILKFGFNFNRMLYNFDFATSHSTGFFLKKKIYNLIGNYNTKFKISADYDLYFRLYKKKLKGGYTRKNQR